MHKVEKESVLTVRVEKNKMNPDKTCTLQLWTVVARCKMISISKSVKSGTKPDPIA